MENFNLALKHFRKQQNLTQQQVADKIPMERSAYASYETGRNEPSLGTLKKLSKVLKVSTDRLLSWEGC